jgi:hypothetical protein
MIVYGSVLAILAASALIQINKPENSTGHQAGKENNLVLLFSCFSIYLLMILKAPLTGDYSRYAYNFLDSANKSLQFYWEREMDAGFYILTKLIGELHYSLFFYFAVTSAFICLSLFFFLKRYACNKKYAVYFYYTIGLFAFTMAGLRQALAMSVCLFAYEAAKKRKIIVFLIFVGTAFLLHKSAIFFLPAFFVGWVPWKRKYHLVILAMYATAGLLFQKLYAWITDWMNYNYTIESTGNGGIFLLILLIIGFLGIVYRQRLMAADKDNLFFLNMHFVVIMLWTFRMFTRTAERPTFYYLYASVILLDRIFSLKSEGAEEARTRKILVLLSVLFFGIFFLYRTLRDVNLVPYLWIFP